ncbi:MAG: hypothetical protein RL642_47 [Bacteroidota bacterium]
MKKLCYSVMLLLQYVFSNVVFSQSVVKETNLATLFKLNAIQYPIADFVAEGNANWFISGYFNPTRYEYKSNGIVRMVGDTVKLYSSTSNNLPTDSLYRMKLINGSIHLFTPKGILRYQDTEFVYSNYGKKIGTTYIRDLVEKSGSLFYATNTGFVKESGSKVQVFTTTDGLPDNKCLKIQLVGNEIFGITETGVFVYNVTSGVINTLHKGQPNQRLDLCLFDGHVMVHSLDFTAFILEIGVWDGAWKSLNDIYGNCDLDIRYTYPQSSLRFWGNDKTTIITLFSTFQKAYLYLGGTKKVLNSINEVDLAYINETTSYWIAYNSKGEPVLYEADNKSAQEFLTDDKLPFEITSANNISMCVGPENLQYNYNYPSSKVLSENCASSFFSRALWISAVDSSQKVHTACNTFNQRGKDFTPGPLGKNGKYKADWKQKYNRVFVVQATEIAKHRKSVLDSGTIRYVNPNIKGWPVYEIDGTDTLKMAPWVDANKNGYYDPEKGDYPKIKGDEALFTVYHDSIRHGETMGDPLLIQVNELTWSVKCPLWQNTDTFGIIDNTVFVEYDLINRSENSYNNARIGAWLDVELGNYTDDFVGCAPSHNVGFGYNSDSMDEGTYGFGTNPPVQNVIFCEGPLADSDGIDSDNDGVVDNVGEQAKMGSFISHDNSNNSVFGNPEGAIEFFRLMNAKYLNGSPIKLDTQVVNFQYSHGEDPSCPGKYWTEKTSGNIIGDRRFVMSTASFNWAPNQTVHQTIAYQTMQTAYKADPVAEVMHVADVVNAVYQNASWMNCQIAFLATEKFSEEPQFEIFPVPANQQLYVKSTTNFNPNALAIYDLAGRKIVVSFSKTNNMYSADLANIPNGIYILNLIDGANSFSAKFIKQ